jgi:hypothetical protein
MDRKKAVKERGDVNGLGHSWLATDCFWLNLLGLWVKESMGVGRTEHSSSTKRMIQAFSMTLSVKMTINRKNAL